MGLISLIHIGLVIISVISAFLALFIVPFCIAKIYIMWRRGDLKHQRDLRFSNTVYLCENTDCDRRFFRMHQVFDAYNRREMFIPGGRHVDEKTYAQNVHVKWVEELEICRCPDCQGTTITRAKQFDWMDENPAFPKLNIRQLAKRRTLFKNTDSEKKTNEALKVIREKINDLDSIAAYQHQYTLSDIKTIDIDARIQDIRKQLKLLQTNTPYQSARKITAELMQLLDAHGTERFSAKQPTPVSMPSDDHEQNMGHCLTRVKEIQTELRTTAFTSRDKNRRNDERYVDYKRKTHNQCHKYNRLRNAYPSINHKLPEIIRPNRFI